MQNVVSCNIRGYLSEQLFQLANIYNYSIKYNKTIILKDDGNINIYLKQLLKNNVLIIDKDEFNRIYFNFHLENINSEIPYYSNKNLYINGKFITNENYTEDTRLFIRNLFINNNKYYNEAKLIFNNIKIYFNNHNENDYILMYYNYTKCSEVDITYYNNAYEYLTGNKKTILVLSNNMTACKQHLSINKNFYFIENRNECIDLLLMLLVPNIISTNLYISWWGAYLNNNNIIIPKQLNKLKLNNCIYI
jgi:hypothetical protein